MPLTEHHFTVSVKHMKDDKLRDSQMVTGDFKCQQAKVTCHMEVI